jgi:CMP-N,N'-diacetyllegionaminic acid synthase
MQDLKDILIMSSASLQDAMEKMTHARKGVLIVINKEKKLVGTLSDGDIRRTILKNVSLTSRVQLALNTDPIFSLNKDEAIELLKSRSLQVVPIVDKYKKIISAVTEETESIVYWEYEFAREARIPANDLVVLIPARGGSKRIPRKNLQKIHGVSLLAKSIQVCKSVFPVECIMVSTDDPAIEKEARSYGINIPWLRPAELSTDASSSYDVVLHLIKKLQETGKLPAALMLIEPTAPLRQPFHLKEAYDLYKKHTPDAVAAVSELPHIYHPEEIVRMSGNGIKAYKETNTLDNRLQRQDQEKLFFKNGIVYVFKINSVLKNKNLFGSFTIPYLVNAKYVADIDEPIDLIIAESKFKNL